MNLRQRGYLNEGLGSKEKLSDGQLKKAIGNALVPMMKRLDVSWAVETGNDPVVVVLRKKGSKSTYSSDKGAIRFFIKGRNEKMFVTMAFEGQNYPLGKKFDRTMAGVKSMTAFARDDLRDQMWRFSDDPKWQKYKKRGMGNRWQ